MRRAAHQFALLPAGLEHPARELHRQVPLSHVNAVRIQRQRHVGAVVNDEDPGGASNALRDLSSGFEQFA